MLEEDPLYCIRYKINVSVSLRFSNYLFIHLTCFFFLSFQSLSFSKRVKFLSCQQTIRCQKKRLGWPLGTSYMASNTVRTKHIYYTTTQLSIQYVLQVLVRMTKVLWPSLLSTHTSDLKILIFFFFQDLFNPNQTGGIRSPPPQTNSSAASKGFMSSQPKFLKIIFENIRLNP